MRWCTLCMFCESKRAVRNGEGASFLMREGAPVITEVATNGSVV